MGAGSEATGPASGKSQAPAVFEGSLDYLRLSILRYDDPADDDWDSNVLLVASFEAMLRGRKWSVGDLAMITFEVGYLADWLDALPGGENAPDLNDELEPDLRFDKVSDHSIRLRFFGAAAPPWVDKGARKSGDCAFEIPIDDRLKLAAAQLRNQLSAAKDEVRPKAAARKKREGRIELLSFFLIPLIAPVFVALEGGGGVSLGDYILMYFCLLFLLFFRELLWERSIPGWMKFRQRKSDRE